MDSTTKDIRLNLREVTLFGADPVISQSDVEKAVEKIEAGEEFEPLAVVKIGPDVYKLLDNHPIARAHFELNKPLNCTVFSEEGVYIGLKVPIQDICYV